MPVLGDIAVLYQCRAEGGQAAVHPILKAALVWDDQRISWVGPEHELPPTFRDLPRQSAGGAIVIPGLIDCHTHLAFGGWRAEEFVRRVEGATYLEIAKAGGGIKSTVRATRAATTEALVDRCLSHLARIAQLGVTCVEVKSGYGLDLDHELRLLDVYRQAQARTPLHLVPTLLGAHTVPAEYVSRRDDYVKLVIDRMIPEAAGRGLARFCDVFVEETAFTVDEARRIFAAARRHGLGAKLHADQLSDGDGAELAAEVGAVSADHLECVSDAGVAALAAAGVVAVSLPLATLYLGQSPMPARRLIEAGVAVAVATDFNPGSAPSHHLPLALTLACTLQRMRPAEALKGATLLAARAVGMEPDMGSLEVGKYADFAVLDAESVDQWIYHFTANACVRAVARGNETWVAGVS